MSQNRRAGEANAEEPANHRKARAWFAARVPSILLRLRAGEGSEVVSELEGMSASGGGPRVVAARAHLAIARLYEKSPELRHLVNHWERMLRETRKQPHLPDNAEALEIFVNRINREFCSPAINDAIKSACGTGGPEGQKPDTAESLLVTKALKKANSTRLLESVRKSKHREEEQRGERQE